METTKTKMEETIKSKEVIAYKGMNSDMSCRDFKYEVGKSYKTDKAELCNCGFHACLNPRDVLGYYWQEEGSRYFKVKLFGEIAKCGMLYTNVAATEITILEEITDTFDEVINTTEWWKNDNVLDLLYFLDGFAIVRRRNNEYNFINTKGKLLSEQWFEWVSNFFNGFAVVRREDTLYNLIDTNGNYLFDKWFSYIDYFKDGIARVQRSDKQCNYINKNGKIISDEWFMWVNDFEDEFARVKREDKLQNLINKDGKILSEQWFDWISGFYDGFSVIGRGNHEYNYIDKQGKIISSEWFKWLDYFHNGFARVQRFDDLMNFIGEDGKIISDEWFRYVDYFDEYDLAVVQRTNGEQCKIDKNGNIVICK